MKLAIADALESKKFLAFLATLIVVIGNKCVGHWGYELDASQVALLVGSAATYMLGQGIADHGKTAADTNAAVAAAIAMPDGAEKTAALALFHGALTPITPSNTTVPKQAQAGFARLGLMIAVAAIGAALLFGCAGSQRTTAINATDTMTDAAGGALRAYSHDHVESIIHRPGITAAAAQLEINAFYAKVDKAEQDITAIRGLIKNARAINDAPSVAALEAKATEVLAELKSLETP